MSVTLVSMVTVTYTAPRAALGVSRPITERVCVCVCVCVYVCVYVCVCVCVSVTLVTMDSEKRYHISEKCLYKSCSYEPQELKSSVSCSLRSRTIVCMCASIYFFKFSKSIDSSIENILLCACVHLYGCVFAYLRYVYLHLYAFV